MRIYIDAKVGIFNVGATDLGLDDAKTFVDWVYSLEAGEERAAIIAADKPRTMTLTVGEVEVDPPFPDAEPEPTVAEVAQFVKDYAAKTDPAKAIALMQTCGIERTSGITEQNKMTVYSKFKEASK
mgnify:CR=1 FL=1